MSDYTDEDLKAERLAAAEARLREVAQETRETVARVVADGKDLVEQQHRLYRSQKDRAAAAEARLREVAQETRETVARVVADGKDLVEQQHRLYRSQKDRAAAAEAQVRELRAALEECVDLLTDWDVPPAYLIEGDPLIRWRALLARPKPKEGAPE